MSKTAGDGSTLTNLIQRDSCEKSACTVLADEKPRALNERAQKLRRFGQHEDAECAAREALCQMLYRGEPRDYSVIAAALYELGYAYSNLGHPEKAPPLLELAATLRKHNGENRQMRAVCSLLATIDSNKHRSGVCN